MSPRWLTIEKLVTELGGVCSAGDEAKRRDAATEFSA
jgi:hypothetical protein